MKLEIKNIGKIKKASIELNGITVIGGENNTGKSTMGKALYSIFNTFYDKEKKLYTVRVNAISNVVKHYLPYTYYSGVFTVKFSKFEKNFIDTILTNIETYNKDITLIQELFIKTIKEEFSDTPISNIEEIRNK